MTVYKQAFTGAPRARVLDRANLSAFQDAAAAEEWQRWQAKLPSDPSQQRDLPGTILLSNQTGAMIERYQPVMIGAPRMKPSENANWAEIANTPMSAVALSSGGGDFHNFAVALDPIKPTYAGFAAVRGMLLCPVNVPSGMTWCDRADVRYNVPTLELAPHGSAKVLWRDDTAEWGLVSLEAPEWICYPGKIANNAADPGDTNVEVTLWKNGSTTSYTLTGVHFSWITGGESISVGKEVMVQWSPWEKIWRIILAECEA